MSDQPTLYQINPDSYVVHTMGQSVVDEVMRWVDVGVLVPVTELLLTREEAALDPDVRLMVMKAWYQGWSGVTGDE